MFVDVALVCSLVAIIINLYFSIKNGRHTDTKDIEKRVEETTRMETKLDMVNRNTSDIKNQIQNILTKVDEHGNRIVELETSAKYLEKRVSDLEARKE